MTEASKADASPSSSPVTLQKDGEGGEKGEGEKFTEHFFGVASAAGDVTVNKKKKP